MKLSNRKGVAMFVVLGAVVLLTLLGFAGMSLAQKDQTLALDVQDLRSRDAALNAAFQLALNRLVSDPANLKVQLDHYIADYQKTASAKRRWFDFTKSPVELVASQPSVYPITGGTEETAVRVSLDALSVRDSLGYTFITLGGHAQGRHGDEQDGFATYRLDGVGSEYTISTTTSSLPLNAAYFGMLMGSGNTRMDISGGTYLAANNPGTDAGLNSGADMVVNGPFKWNGTQPYTMNATMGVTFNGLAYFRNGIKFNGGGTVTFNDNAMIDGPIDQLQGDLLGNKHLWISGACANCVANNAVIVRGDDGLVFQDLRNYGQYVFKLESARGNIHLGGGFNGTNVGAKSFHGTLQAAGDLVIHGASMFWDFRSAISMQIGGGLLTGIGSNIKLNPSVMTPMRDFHVPNPFIASQTIAVTSRAYYQGVFGSGTISIPSQVSWNPNLSWPTTQDYGIPNWLTQTALAVNPIDSAIVLNRNAPLVFSALKPWSASGYGLTGFNPCNLNAWWRKDSANGTLFNGYLLIAMDQSLTVGTCSETDLHGKFVFVVRELIRVGHSWPASRTRQDIQVISVEGRAAEVPANGVLGDWGLKSGNFAGMLYWDDPEGDSKGQITMQFDGTQPDTVFGCIALTQSRTDQAAKLNFNAGSGANTLRIQLELSVFMDIASNLPGVLRPAANAAGNIGAPRQTFTVVTSNPTSQVRLVTSQISFSPVGSWR